MLQLRLLEFEHDAPGVSWEPTILFVSNRLVSWAFGDVSPVGDRLAPAVGGKIYSGQHSGLKSRISGICACIFMHNATCL